MENKNIQPNLDRDNIQAQFHKEIRTINHGLEQNQKEIFKKLIIKDYRIEYEKDEKTGRIASFTIFKNDGTLVYFEDLNRRAVSKGGGQDII